MDDRLKDIPESPDGGVVKLVGPPLVAGLIVVQNVGALAFVTPFAVMSPTLS